MPVRRAHANHGTACVGRRWDFEARKVAQWVEQLTHHQPDEGSTPSFSLVKALNRLAVRIRSHPRGTREPSRRAVVNLALRRGVEDRPAAPARLCAAGNGSMPMIGQPVATIAGKDASRCGRPAAHPPGPPRRPPHGRGTRSQSLQPCLSTQPAGAVLNDILTLGGGGPESVPIATRHARPPDAAEQED